MFTTNYLLLIFLSRKYFQNSNLMLPLKLYFANKHRIKSSYNNFIHFSSNSFTVYKYTVAKACRWAILIVHRVTDNLELQIITLNE